MAEIISFRPAGACTDELLAVCRRTERLGVPAVMTIHSNELSPGTSATVPDEGACRGYYERLERVFARAGERGWRSATLTEVARRLTGRDATQRREASEP